MISKISIVTPVYNDRRVERALGSILSQECSPEIETIVIDGGSTDGTLEVLEKYRARLTCLVSEKDRGIYDAMNKGIARATGDVVGILNADDRYADNRVLADVIDRFSDVSVEVCYGDLVYVDREDRVVRYWRSGPYRNRNFYLGWMPPHPTFFVRRQLYEKYGVFDTGLPISADYELMLRMIVGQRAKPAYVDRVLVRMAVGGNSGRSVRQIVRANIEVARAWRKNRLAGGLLVPILKPARKIVQFFSRP